MHHYLETKHLEDYKELEAKEKQLAQEKEHNGLGSSGSNQPTLNEGFATSQPLALTTLELRKSVKGLVR